VVGFAGFDTDGCVSVGFAVEDVVFVVVDDVDFVGITIGFTVVG
jgi:hypothetical protein